MAPKATQTKNFNGRTVRSSTIQGLAAAATPSARQPLNLYRGRYGPGVQPTHFQKPDEWVTWGLDEEQDTKVPATTTQEEHDYEPPKKKLFKGKEGKGKAKGSKEQEPADSPYSEMMKSVIDNGWKLLRSKGVVLKDIQLDEEKFFLFEAIELQNSTK